MSLIFPDGSYTRNFRPQDFGPDSPSGLMAEDRRSGQAFAQRPYRSPATQRLAEENRARDERLAEENRARDDEYRRIREQYGETADVRRVIEMNRTREAEAKHRAYVDQYGTDDQKQQLAMQDAWARQRMEYQERNRNFGQVAQNEQRPWRYDPSAEGGIRYLDQSGGRGAEPGRAQPAQPPSQGTPYTVPGDPRGGWPVTRRPGHPPADQSRSGRGGQTGAQQPQPQMFGRPPSQSVFGDPQGGWAAASPQDRPPPFQMGPVQGPWGQSEDPFAARMDFVNQMQQQNMQRQMMFNNGGFNPSQTRGQNPFFGGGYQQPGQAQPIQPPSQGTPYGQPSPWSQYGQQPAQGAQQPPMWRANQNANQPFSPPQPPDNRGSTTVNSNFFGSSGARGPVQARNAQSQDSMAAYRTQMAQPRQSGPMQGKRYRP